MNSIDTETVTDIVAEIRAYGAQPPPRCMWLDIADRVEIAARRERDHAIEHATRHAEAVARDNCRDCVHNPNGKNYEDGNAAAMREALVAIQKLVQANIASDEFDDLEPLKEYVQIRDICNAALSAPPRNCDVGTAEEQTRRMYAQLCSKQRSCYELPSGEHCPLHCTGVDCRLLWAQMPYKAEEGGAK